MKIRISYLFPLCMLFICSCKNSNASAHKNSEVLKDTIKTFTLPTIPNTIEEPEQRAAYLVHHYWDHVNFADTNYIHHPEITEQAWVDYCNILIHVPLHTAQEEVRKTIDRCNVEKKVLNYITDLADKYLYDPNSPIRNEEFYIPVLEAMVASPTLNEWEKVRPEARLKLAQKNRIGTKAIDFTFTLDSGIQKNLYALKADYILLFINNPGCHACSETINELKRAPAINQLLATNKLILLSLYPDEELDEWHKHLDEFPKEWINAYDKKFVLKEKQLYDLKAIPTLYLLDQQKKVLLKDATTQSIETFLSRN